MATAGGTNYNIKNYNIEPIIAAPIIVLVTIVLAAIYDPVALKAGATAVVALSPLWVPLFLLNQVWYRWIKFIRTQFWFKQDNVLLEITLPPEVEKSPLAMEVVLNTLWSTAGEATFISRIWYGSFRALWSLEIASNEGRVSYYMHMRRSWRNIIEARMYGQFPEAKIIEVEDYVTKVPFNLEEYNLWGCEYAKRDPGAVPIRTYQEFELDKDTDVPETTVDPISHILEYFSHVGKGEYVWLQFLLKARKKDEWYGFYLAGDEFKDGGKKVIQSMVKEAAERSKKLLESMGIEDKEKTALKQAASRGGALLTEDERNKVEAIEKSMGKQHIFEVGIRGIYLAKKDTYNASSGAPGIIPLFYPFNSQDLNAIVPARGLLIFDYPWQDFHDIRKNIIKKQLYNAYKHRAYFYVPYDQVPIFMNLEELATLWHFPQSGVNPPGLERVQAKRAEAPAGLPTGIN